VATGVGGGVAFIGGFLALMGGMADRSGLAVGGAVTAGVGLVAIVPGVYLIASSGSKAEVRSENGTLSDASRTPGIGVSGAF
jgi:hypothetical protein